MRSEERRQQLRTEDRQPVCPDGNSAGAEEAGVSNPLGEGETFPTGGSSLPEPDHPGLAEDHGRPLASGQRTVSLELCLPPPSEVEIRIEKSRRAPPPNPLQKERPMVIDSAAMDQIDGIHLADDARIVLCHLEPGIDFCESPFWPKTFRTYIFFFRF
jgi:hypothetical protein